jgi:PEP-CTERM motif
MKRIMCFAGTAILAMLAGSAQATVVFDMDFTLSDQWLNAPGGPLTLGTDGVVGRVMVAPDVFATFPALFASPNPAVSFLAAGWVEFLVTNAPDLTYPTANPAEVLSWDIGFDATGALGGANASLSIQQDAAFQDVFGTGWIMLDGTWNALLGSFPVVSSTGPTYLSAWTQGPPATGAPGYILFATADPNLVPLVNFTGPNGATLILVEGSGNMTASAEPLIPEPATLALLGLALTGMLARRRARG